MMSKIPREQVADEVRLVVGDHAVPGVPRCGAGRPGRRLHRAVLGRAGEPEVGEELHAVDADLDAEQQLVERDRDRVDLDADDRRRRDVLHELDDVDDVAEAVVEDRHRMAAGHERLDLGRVLALDLVEVLLGVHQVGGAAGQQPPTRIQAGDLEEAADDVRGLALEQRVPADPARRVGRARRVRRLRLRPGGCARGAGRRGGARARRRGRRGRRRPRRRHPGDEHRRGDQPRHDLVAGGALQRGDLARPEARGQAGPPGGERAHGGGHRRRERPRRGRTDGGRRGDDRQCRELLLELRVGFGHGAEERT